MTHRIREAMKDPVFTKMGGGGKIVEADETYWGKKPEPRTAWAGPSDKEKIFALVERGGQVRSFHVPDVSSATLRPIMLQQIEYDTKVMTDEASVYRKLKPSDFKSHKTINHSSKVYVRGEIHTNTIEGYFSILKRGLTGIYQHVGSQHLKCYIEEFDFRYNNCIALGI
jgi:transposase-like protein